MVWLWGVPVVIVLAWITSVVDDRRARRVTRKTGRTAVTAAWPTLGDGKIVHRDPPLHFPQQRMDEVALLRELLSAIDALEVSLFAQAAEIIRLKDQKVSSEGIVQSLQNARDDHVQDTGRGLNGLE
jgi:hypothetical protein